MLYWVANSKYHSHLTLKFAAEAYFWAHQPYVSRNYLQQNLPVFLDEAQREHFAFMQNTRLLWIPISNFCLSSHCFEGDEQSLLFNWTCQWWPWWLSYIISEYTHEPSWNIRDSCVLSKSLIRIQIYHPLPWWKKTLVMPDGIREILAWSDII